MNSLIQLKKTATVFVVGLGLAFFALSPRAQAVTPAPDGGYAGNNTAEGTQALQSLVSGALDNTAIGFQALFRATDSLQNTATGFRALFNNVGDFNVAMGYQAALGNTAGDHNTAVGFNALMRNTTGDNNTALGFNAGANLTIGDDNIDIGNAGVTGEHETIRIGTAGFQSRAFIVGIRGVAVNGSTVVVNASGQLGVLPSSNRFKDGIKTMDKVSEAILALRPVTFYYKKDVDPDGIQQFGLVAEEVAKVNPALVTRDASGRPFTVRYNAVNAMLLNEFLKEHRKVEVQEKTILELKSGMTALAATVKEQADQIQKVSAQLEATKPTPQVVKNP
jgi:trimeric autotransporter adhesin